MGYLRSTLSTLLTTLVVAGIFPSPAAAEPGEPALPCQDPRGCPDLVVDPDTMNPSVHTKDFKENSCVVEEGMIESGTRTVLRFTYTTPNFGDGDLIVGRPEDHPELFEFSECHGHFHFREYADYRLWTPEDFAEWDALREANPDLLPEEVLAANPGLAEDLVVGEKAGFCVIDLILYEPAPPKFLLCDFQGISVGWADEYDSDLDGQFIDVTDVAPGTYVLESEVNAERLFEEMDYANNRASVEVTI